MKILPTLIIVTLLSIFDSCKKVQIRPMFQSPICDISYCIFDTLSLDVKNKFLEKHRDKFKPALLTYYDNYDKVEHIDSIFDILSACDFSTETSDSELAFYCHVLNKVINNDNVDGYVSEMCMDQCYSLFNNHPAYFYQYYDFVDDETKSLLISYIYANFQILEIDIDKINVKLQEHIDRFPQQKAIIDNVKNRFMILNKYPGAD